MALDRRANLSDLGLIFDGTQLFDPVGGSLLFSIGAPSAYPAASAVGFAVTQGRSSTVLASPSGPTKNGLAALVRSTGESAGGAPASCANWMSPTTPPA
jgi:hypothetical protein